MVGLEHLFLDFDGPASLGKRLLRVFLVLGLCAFVLGIAIVEYRKSLAMDSWSRAPCTVVQSYVESEGNGRDRCNPYHPRVIYRFGPPGQKRVAANIESTDAGTDSASAAYATTRPYAAGSEATCYVNDAPPPDAVLVRPPVRSMAIFLASAIVVTLSVTWLYCLPQLGWRRRRRYSHETYVKYLGRPILILAFLVGAGSSLAWWYLIPLAKNIESLAWPAVPCRIVEANIMRNEVHGEVHLTLYTSDIHYAYFVGGTEYHSNCYSFTEGSGLVPWSREALTQAFAATKSATCFVNPNAPEDAVLSRHLSPTLSYSIFPLLFLLLPVAVIVSWNRGSDAWLTARVRRHKHGVIGTAVTLLLVLIWSQFAPP